MVHHGSLFLQKDTSIIYVKEQMRHSSVHCGAPKRSQPEAPRGEKSRALQEMHRQAARFDLSGRLHPCLQDLLRSASPDPPHTFQTEADTERRGAHGLFLPWIQSGIAAASLRTCGDTTRDGRISRAAESIYIERLTDAGVQSNRVTEPQEFLTMSGAIGSVSANQVSNLFAIR